MHFVVHINTYSNTCVPESLSLGIPLNPAPSQETVSFPLFHLHEHSFGHPTIPSLILLLLLPLLSEEEEERRSRKRSKIAIIFRSMMAFAAAATAAGNIVILPATQRKKMLSLSAHS